MSTDTIRRAAAAMRERAEAATPGTWMPDPDEEVGTAEVIIEEYECHEVARISCDFGTDAAHIASWHPAVALAVADWLEVVAGYGEPQPGHGTRNFDAALVAARAYLGEDA